MANFTYLVDSDNVALQGVISASSADANYPIENLSALPISKPWRSAAGGLSSVKLRIDFLFPRAINCVALVNHNLTSAATITMNGGSVADPDGSEFTTTITWAARTAWKVLSGTETWAYWSITITDEANSYGFIQVGYLVMGAKTTLAFNFAPDWTVERLTKVRRSSTESRVPIVGNTLSKNSRLIVSFTTRANADKTTVDNFLNSLNREAGPLLVIPDTAETEALFCRLVVDHSIRRQAKWSDIPELIFEEDATGIVIPADTVFHYLPDGTAKNIIGEATFARNSTATYYDSDLIVRTAAIDEPRDAHYPISGLRSILIESERTNAFTKSEQFDNAAWTKLNSSASPNTASAPDALTTADSMIEDATAAAQHGITRNAPTLTNDTQQAFSVFLKANTRTWAYIETINKAAQTLRHYLNLSTGALGTAPTTTARVVALTNGWYRFSVELDSGSGGTTPQVGVFMATADNTPTYNGNGTSGIYIWGAQFETDKMVTSSYIPTDTTVITRTADSLMWPFDFVPQSMTVYFQFMELGTFRTEGNYLRIGSDSTDEDSVGIEAQTGAGVMEITHKNSSSVTSSELVLGTASGYASRRECRAILYPSGAVQMYESEDGETPEDTGVKSGALTMDTAWGAAELWIGLPADAFCAYAVIKIAHGVQTRAYMRAL